MSWTVHRLAETGSTNDDAACGSAWEAWTALAQRAGRGRIGHKWHSHPGENLILSAVLPLPSDPEEAATLPLAVGLAVADAAARLLGATLPDAPPPLLKWPNDIVAGGRKLAGILCERHGDRAVAGIGMNVLQMDFPPDVARRATSMALLGAGGPVTVEAVLEAVLDSLDRTVRRWLDGGFVAIWPEIARIDALKGCVVEVLRTDGDESPVSGGCEGIAQDGALIVGGVKVWAGEAHISSIARV